MQFLVELIDSLNVIFVVAGMVEGVGYGLGVLKGTTAMVEGYPWIIVQAGSCTTLILREYLPGSCIRLLLNSTNRLEHRSIQIALLAQSVVLCARVIWCLVALRRQSDASALMRPHEEPGYSQLHLTVRLLVDIEH